MHNHHLTNSANVTSSPSTSSNSTLHGTPSITNTDFLPAENYGYHHQSQPHQQVQSNLKNQINFNCNTITNHSNTAVNGPRAIANTDLAQYLISNASNQNTCSAATAYTNENYSTPYYNNHIPMDTWPRYMTSDCRLN